MRATPGKLILLPTAPLSGGDGAGVWSTYFANPTKLPIISFFRQRHVLWNRHQSCSSFKDYHWRSSLALQINNWRTFTQAQHCSSCFLILCRGFSSYILDERDILTSIHRWNRLALQERPSFVQDSCTCPPWKSLELRLWIDGHWRCSTENMSCDLIWSAAEESKKTDPIYFSWCMSLHFRQP